MERREFIRAGTLALIAAGTPAYAGALAAPEDPLIWRKVSAPADFSNRIKRDIEMLPPLKIKEITVRLGAKKPFSVMHVSDSHIVRADGRDDERKWHLAAARSGHMRWGEHYLEEAMCIASEKGMYLVHTGDLYDFVSEANLDSAAVHLGAADWMVSVGNHEFSKYVGEAKEDEAYKDDNREKVQAAFPNDLRFHSRIINGVNFVALDDVYYNVTVEQHRLMEAEMAKGLPIVLLCHVPFYIKELCDFELEQNGGRCAYLTGVPEEITSRYEPGVKYPAGEEWRYRSVQQKADRPTLDFIAWLREQPLLKAILCGHCHVYHEDRFSPGAMQYVVGAGYRGEAQVIHFR